MVAARCVWTNTRVCLFSTQSPRATCPCPRRAPSQLGAASSPRQPPISAVTTHHTCLSPELPSRLKNKSQVQAKGTRERALETNSSGDPSAARLPPHTSLLAPGRL